MFRIWIDEPFNDVCLPLLGDDAVLVGPGAPLSELATCHASLVPGSRVWNAALLDQAPALKVLSRLGVGYDNIDVAACTARGVLACYAPEAPSISTAEHAVALMLAAAKQLRQADTLTRAGKWRRWFVDNPGMELDGRTLGLVGLGRIGARVAAVGRALGMQVLAFDPFLSAERAANLGVILSPGLDALLAQSDVVSLHLPATAETANLMNAARFAQMKPGAIFVNAARGALVDTPALAAALRSGHLAYAGLDVYEVEPIVADSPLHGIENLVLSPHIASQTVAGFNRIYDTALAQALTYLRGGRPAHPLNAV